MFYYKHTVGVSIKKKLINMFVYAVNFCSYTERKSESTGQAFKISEIWVGLEYSNQCISSYEPNCYFKLW